MMVLHCDRCGRIIEKEEEMSTLEICSKKYNKALSVYNTGISNYRLCSDCTSYLNEVLTNGKENK